MIDTTERGIALAGGSSARMAVGQACGAGQALAYVAGKRVLAAERMAVTGAEDSATSPYRLLAFVTGQCVCWAMNTPTLRARLDAGGAKAPGAA